MHVLVFLGRGGGYHKNVVVEGGSVSIMLQCFWYSTFIGGQFLNHTTGVCMLVCLV